MDIQATKIELVKAILEIDDKDFIKKVATFVYKERVDFWDELTSSQRQEIMQGIKDLDKGERIGFDEFIAKVS
jgi:hypothetical protein